MVIHQKFPVMLICFIWKFKGEIKYKKVWHACMCFFLPEAFLTISSAFSNALPHSLANIVEQMLIQAASINRQLKGRFQE